MEEEERSPFFVQVKTDGTAFVMATPCRLQEKKKFDFASWKFMVCTDAHWRFVLVKMLCHCSCHVCLVMRTVCVCGGSLVTLVTPLRGALSLRTLFPHSQLLVRHRCPTIHSVVIVFMGDNSLFVLQFHRVLHVLYM